MLRGCENENTSALRSICAVSLQAPTLENSSTPEWVPMASLSLSQQHRNIPHAAESIYTHIQFSNTHEKSTHTHSVHVLSRRGKRENDNKRGTNSLYAKFCCVEQCPHTYQTYMRQFRHFYSPFVTFYSADGTCKIIEYPEVCLTTQWILSLQQLLRS